MRNINIHQLRIGVILAGLLVLCSCSEQPERYFEKYTVELHEGGWVPDIFPHDITRIYEVHDIDTNEVWVRFNGGEAPLDVPGFEEIEISEIQETKFPNPRFNSWWFEGVTEQQPANDAALYARIYKGSCGIGRVAYLAKSKYQNVHYWWCQSGETHNKQGQLTPSAQLP